MMNSHIDQSTDDADKGERKRQREKQRRSDLATAFEDLQAALNRIELSADGYSRVNKVDWNSETPVTRLGLVVQTTETLQRLYQENLSMRLALGGHWVDDTPRQRTFWRSDHGHYYSHPHQHPNYYPGFPEAYQTSPAHLCYNGFHGSWERDAHPQGPYNDASPPPPKYDPSSRPQSS